MGDRQRVRRRCVRNQIVVGETYDKVPVNRRGQEVEPTTETTGARGPVGTAIVKKRKKKGLSET